MSEESFLTQVLSEEDQDGLIFYLELIVAISIDNKVGLSDFF